MHESFKELIDFLLYCVAHVRMSAGAFLRARKSLADRYPQYKIGHGSYGPLQIDVFGDHCTLEIGAYCSIAEGVTVMLGGEHRTDCITTYPFDHLDKALPHNTFARGDVVIGNDVWIGRDALILSGTVIGDGAIIGARSVVRGHLEPYTIYAGTPARPVRPRFSRHEIDSLLKIAWWNWPEAKILQQAPLLTSSDVQTFIGAHLPPATDNSSSN